VFERFSGLSGHPFAPSPDPAFYFPSRAHEHVYRRLQHGWHQGGLTVLTGDDGTHDAHALPPHAWRDLHRLPLQTFLVGRPELRHRVRTSCHLGPLERDETRRYIEHRLKHVGWKGDPPFDEDAFALIHSCTGGIPRHINQLCTRILTAVFVTEQGRVGAAALKRLIS